MYVKLLAQLLILILQLFFTFDKKKQEEKKKDIEYIKKARKTRTEEDLIRAFNRLKRRRRSGGY